MILIKQNAVNIGVTDLAHTKKIQVFGVLITQTKSTSTFVTLIDFFALVHKNAIFKKNKKQFVLSPPPTTLPQRVLRPDFKSALRVVKMVLNTKCYQYL